MPSGTIASVEQTGRPHNVITISTPTGGVIKTLNVRGGMTLMAGQTLAEVNGLGTVWLNAAVPEAVAGPLKPGQAVRAALAAFPRRNHLRARFGDPPETQADSRTLTVRSSCPIAAGDCVPACLRPSRLAGARSRRCWCRPKP
jgi:Cu(I)/Ag(I) efflux system membrane fusion protein